MIHLISCVNLSALHRNGQDIITYIRVRQEDAYREDFYDSSNILCLCEANQEGFLDDNEEQWTYLLYMDRVYMIREYSL